MELSKRLNFIIDNIENTSILADIGTDHGYIPLYATQNGLCNKAIAIDINKDPLDKARLNAILEGAGDELEFRLGNGFQPIEEGEVEVAIIAGMGGNLIRDILEESIDKVSSLNYLILVPAQNPEVLREYLYNNDYEIIKEDLCEEEGIYYELFKVRKKAGESIGLDPIYYEVSPKLLMQKHPLMKDYLNSKIENYKKILSFITESTITAKERRASVEEKINIISNMMNYL
ncbi:class I SAM-dependent methyltransferase [Clostridium sp. AL.422]|uniref:tRNA (adenine(22)-N(1))-methyltransferase n=1 Tax=Clostridium TaxID=1485 RepID=UPI00293DB13F|nr:MULTISPECIES: class I SAM-dependent methyltransferase [unclassified Clostridium]MDV4150122.1 class I SAM-dependent methyltransferase [Clostridium sp. AL.422]